ncbi:MAG: carboxypeptidase regulatory-like domain-containing protein [Bryobacterales bacterium]|nr:carboxypeptidase regulatory-like domain-containing protein [Bryobacterales bacterium]
MLLTLMLFTVTLWGQQPQVAIPGRQTPQPAQTLKPEELCSVSGVVKHAVTGEALRKATLTLWPMESRNAAVPSTTVTDAEGKFSMKEIEPGQYRFTAVRTGFVQTNYRSTPANRQGATLTLAKGQSVKDVEFRLLPHAVISGRVTDEDGDPIQHAQVQLMIYRTMQGKRQLMPASGGSTNDLGEYRLFGIAPGRYYLSVTQRPNYAFAGGVDRSAVQAPDESYPMTYFPGTLEVTGASPLNVASGATMQGVDVMLRKVRSFRVRGRVTGIGSGMRGGNVTVMPKSAAGNAMGFSMMQQGTMWRGPGGEFELRGVRPGSYFVMAHAWEPPSKQFIGRETIEVGNEDVEGVTLTLSSGVEVNGSLRVESDTPTEAKFEEMFVALSPPAMFVPVYTTPGKVTREGSFQIANATAETYNVRVMGMPPEFFVKSVRMGDIDVMENGLTVSGTPVSGVDVVISPKGAEVSGTVTDKDGKLLAAAAVVLHPLSAKPSRQAELQRMASADQNGAFRFRGLPPGEYRLYAFEGIEGGEAGDADLLKEHEAKAVTLSLKEGAREARELKAVLVENR